MQRYAAKDEKFDAPDFYRCLTEQGTDFLAFRDDLKHLGPAELYLRTSMRRLPKRVAMIRKTGMVIKLRRFNSPIDYCGAFLCRNEDGNHKLRDMEPPEHNEWSPNLPDHGASKKYDDEIVAYVRVKIRELLDVDDSKPLDPEGLGKYLPETDKDGKDGGLGKPPGDRKESDVEISQRTFSTGKFGEKYTINVRPSDKGRHTVDLTVRIVGEDGVENLAIATASHNGKTLKVSRPNIIRDVRLAAAKSTAIEITLVTPQRVALEVVAHED